MPDHVVVVIGVGGMGEAIARRQGIGRRLLIADVDDTTTGTVAAALTADGYEVVGAHVDVTPRESVRALAQTAAAAGSVVQMIHTAGLSPVQASAEAILRVDLYGTAVVLAEFGDVIAEHGAGVVIASMAGRLAQLSPDHESALATTDVDEILGLPFLAPDVLADPAQTYMVSKRANVLRVAAESMRWGRRRARLNTISPGAISTPMGRQELNGTTGEGLRALIAASGTGRIGTSADIAAAAGFLLGPDASFITGTDLLVDGGASAALSMSDNG